MQNTETKIIWAMCGSDIYNVKSVEEVKAWRGGRQITEVEACMEWCFSTIVAEIDYANQNAPEGDMVLEGTIPERMKRIAERLCEEGEWVKEFLDFGC
jgi:hypothetical protein